MHDYSYVGLGITLVFLIYPTFLLVLHYICLTMSKTKLKEYGAVFVVNFWLLFHFVNVV